jgi:hypothetical protein
MLDNFHAPLDVEKKEELKKQNNIRGKEKNDIGSLSF